MKIIDEKGKLFGKVNLLDLLVIVLIVAAVVFVALKLGGVIGSGENSEVEYKIEILAVRQETIDALNKNLNGIYATANDAGQILGDITDIEVRNARELTLLDSGEYTYAEHENKYDVTITVRAICSVKDKGIYVAGGTQILCGEEMKFSNGHCSTSGEVISINVITDGK